MSQGELPIQREKQASKHITPRGFGQTKGTKIKMAIYCQGLSPNQINVTTIVMLNKVVLSLSSFPLLSPSLPPSFLFYSTHISLVMSSQNYVITALYMNVTLTMCQEITSHLILTKHQEENTIISPTVQKRLKQRVYVVC